MNIYEVVISEKGSTTAFNRYHGVAEDINKAMSIALNEEISSYKELDEEAPDFEVSLAKTIASCDFQQDQ